ncbi:alpha/beta fold hydrolase [Legionella parisiensis]|uniref:3-oxoadipate enol-lactonase 2 n=1 Tax=Legionella parisiensis TaxID=45071 RepID=A0A1E5JVP5_9GAMM|nr:alpha/beta fold hydrolase [Legionella parisiensis]KTD40501.1 alpha/beta hydrolase [Legionella parisiensis]OEH48443.1 3-oxoadipate enol-lactonase 2 [Legionella parisiensis]STX77064.1 alpha/beta hydrolase [Legionella parisiensis]
MPHIKINDIAMYYEIHGNGKPLVFIAGFSADHTTWLEVVELFKDTYQVILFDNRGAGRTEVPDGPYSIEQMADDVLALCSVLNIKKAHFVGNSMGGFIVQTLAYRYPMLVQSAVVSNSAAILHNVFHIYVDAQLELIKTNASLKALLKANCSWVFSYPFLSRPGILDQLIQIGLENPFPFTVNGYEGQYAALVHFDSRSWISKISVPVFVLTADQDIIFNEKNAQFLADQIPGAHYYRFMECGHLPQIEYPELFTKTVRGFIDNLS